MKTINSVKDIQALVLAGETDWKQYGCVRVKEQGGFLIFNYTAEAQYKNTWAKFERLARGLIISRDGEIIARSFDKFLNYGQNDEYPKSKMVAITAKEDGSLGILYRDNGYKIATRGSLHSDQAIWATAFLNTNYDLAGLANAYTLLFEIIYPENRIVVDYGAREDLVLLSAINRFTGQELPFNAVTQIADRYGFTLVKTYNFTDADEILKWTKTIIGVENEGCVVRYADGSRLKFKGSDYVKLHKQLSNLTFKNIFIAYVDNDLKDFIKYIPDEFLEEIKTWIKAIDVALAALNKTIDATFDILPKTSHKDFALAISEKRDLPLLFAKLDNKPAIYQKLAYKRVFETLKQFYN